MALELQVSTWKTRKRKVTRRKMRFGRMPRLLPGKRLRTWIDLPVLGGESSAVLMWI